MDRKIKIVRIINRFNLGGPTFNATFLTKFIGEEFETTLIGGVLDEDETDSLHILKEYGVEPIIIPEIQRSINPMNEYKAYVKIKKIIEEIQPDIVHTHASKAGFLGRAAAISAKTPVILHTFHGHVFHSYFGKAKTQVFKEIERYLARKSTGIIAISDIQKEELSAIHKIAKPEKVRVIPLGFDLQKFQENKTEKRQSIREKYGLTDEVAIAIVGRLVPVKDHFYFLEVIEQLAAKTSQTFKVFVVGGGSEHEVIEKRIAEVHERFPNLFIMTSWVLDVATFIQGMDIICLTSKNEGTPVSLIEAQAAGIPVVSTDVGGVKDIVADGQSGFVIKKEDIETYIEKLRLLVEDASLREKFSIFGTQNVLEKYSYQRLAEDTGNYYKELLKK